MKPVKKQRKTAEKSNGGQLPVDLSMFAGGGSTYTLQEIADHLGITRERVRQIENSALKKLRHPKLRKKWIEIQETIEMLQNNHKSYENVAD